MLYDTNPTIVKLTKAQYDALDAADKNNDTIYFITDVNGDGQSFQPVIYSTEEREIGVWTDGKPLYQKTLAFQAPSTRDYTQQSLGVSVDYATIVDSAVINNNGQIGIFNGDYDGSPANDEWQGFINKTSNTFDYRVGANYLNANCYLTIRYTKSTDAAGSGIWTPQGIPAHHYSEDEQVVGTWIDGSTLYEKTFYSDTVISYDSASVVTLNDTIPSNIEVVDIQAYFRGTNSGGNQVYQSDGGRWFHYYYESTENKIYAAQVFTSAGVTNCKTYFTIRYIKSST